MDQAWRQGSSVGTWSSPGYRPSALRAKVAMGFVGLTVAAGALNILQELMGFGILDAAVAGALSDAEAAAYDDRSMLLGFVQLGLYIASAVAVLAWLSRVVENVPVLTGAVPKRSQREAIGWWFVPLANWVVPYQVTSDTVERLDVGDGRRAAGLLAPWWLAWVVSNIVGNVAGRVPMDTIEQLRTRFVLLLVSDVALVAAGICLLLIIREAERRSLVRATGLGIAGHPGPVWPPLTASMVGPFAGTRGNVPIAWDAAPAPAPAGPAYPGATFGQAPGPGLAPIPAEVPVASSAADPATSLEPPAPPA